MQGSKIHIYCVFLKYTCKLFDKLYSVYSFIIEFSYQLNSVEKSVIDEVTHDLIFKVTSVIPLRRLILI